MKFVNQSGETFIALFFRFERLLARKSEVRWQDGDNSPRFIPNPMDKQGSQNRMGVGN